VDERWACGELAMPMQNEARGRVAGRSAARARRAYDEIVARDKASLDIFWLRDESIEDSANLPEPHVLAEEIADDLRCQLGTNRRCPG